MGSEIVTFMTTNDALVPQWLMDGIRLVTILLSIRAAICVLIYDLEHLETEAGVAILTGLVAWTLSILLLLGYPATARHAVAHAGSWALTVGLTRYVVLKRDVKHDANVPGWLRFLCHPFRFTRLGGVHGHHTHQ